MAVAMHRIKWGSPERTIDSVLYINRRKEAGLCCSTDMSVVHRDEQPNLIQTGGKYWKKKVFCSLFKFAFSLNMKVGFGKALGGVIVTGERK
jgi:hypothetical protein